MRALPPLTSLRAFEAAARLLSFHGAAAELSVTPTAISHQIRLLEGSCGKLLFKRRPRPMSLTPAGSALLPLISQGLDLFEAGFSSVSIPAHQRLRITATNAFAARWIVPRMPSWLARHPDIGLDIMGTDDVLDLTGDQIDIAIRYARNRPKGVMASEIGRDRYIVVASPSLVGFGLIELAPQDLTRFPLIDGQWDEGSPNPPMWFEWIRMARAEGLDVPDLTKHITLSFREDLHGIEAAIAGHGIAICSDALVAPELASGRLLKVSSVELDGYGFYIACRPNHPRQRILKFFESWILGKFHEGQKTSA